MFFFCLTFCLIEIFYSVPNEPKSTPVDIPRPTFPRPTPVSNQQPYTSLSGATPEPHQDDIRLCTINRANATDTYGIELNYHKRDQYHSMKITAGRDDAPSSKNFYFITICMIYDSILLIYRCSISWC
jgi:hypothetical protein